MCKNKSWKMWTRRFGKGWYGDLDARASEQGRAGLKIQDFGSTKNTFGSARIRPLLVRALQPLGQARKNRVSCVNGLLGHNQVAQI